jgi:hypothetical protein
MNHECEPGRDQERDRLEIAHRIERRPARRNRSEHQRTAAAEQKGVAVDGERATAAAPNEPPAPPMFSTTTVPSDDLTRSAHGRPTAS